MFLQRCSASLGLARRGPLTHAILSRNFRTTSVLHKVLAGKLLTVDRHVYRLNNPPELVVFDKDGTLVDFHSMWSPWLLQLVMNFETSTGRKVLGDAIHDLMGYDQERKQFIPGSILAEDTMTMCKRALEKLLVTQFNYTEADAREVVNENWIGGRSMKGGENIVSQAVEKVFPIGDVLLLFKVLKKFNIRIAVCTSDNRLGTTQALQDMGLLPDIEALVCGDDPFSKPKPAPNNALYLSNLFNCPPEKMAVVGDTPSDTGMGKAAGLGTVIGVESGVCDRETLLSDSDYVVEDIHDILDVVLPGRLHTDEMSRNTAVRHASSLAALREELLQAGIILGKSISHTDSRLHHTLCHTRKGLNLKDSKSFSNLNLRTTRELSTTAGAKDAGKGDNVASNVNNPFLFDTSWKYEADYVIVGAGSAGCTLANRLTEENSSGSTPSVLLLEAGPRDYSWTVHMPVALMYNLGNDTTKFNWNYYSVPQKEMNNRKIYCPRGKEAGPRDYSWTVHMPVALMYNLGNDTTKFNWNYYSVPQKEMNNRKIYCPRGKGWGGSSSINGMAYVRGHAEDYNRWAYKEGVGMIWDYHHCLPYFKRSQTHQYGSSKYRGGDGPLFVSRGSSGNELHDVWIKAGQEAGFAFTDDQNGYQQEGVGWMDLTVRKGVRWSTANAYLRPALSRSQLSTLTKVVVNKVIFEGNKAVGLMVEQPVGSEPIKIRAHKEVILSAGSIGSPQLLMLSGIGNQQHLKDMGIKVMQHLPGVGMNLQDHLEVYVQHKCAKPVTLYSAQRYPKKLFIGVQWFLTQKGPCGSSHMESGGFIRTNALLPHPNIQYHFLPSTVIDHGRIAPPFECYQAHVGTLRPKSRGTLKLVSANPRDAPLIDPNYFSEPEDLTEFVDAIRITRDIFKQPAFDAYRDFEVSPGEKIQSKEAVEEFIRNNADTAYHHSCTCRMGPESKAMEEDSHEASVVLPGGKVIGVEGLRVVDSSIFPSMVSGNLNAATIMTAEKISDDIKGVSSLPPMRVAVYKSSPETIYNGNLNNETE